MAKLTALVTGASTGIGYEFAKLLAADGLDLLLVARGADRLRALADEVSALRGVRATVYAADLSVPGAAADLYRRIADDGHVVDVLVNNAGFGSYGAFHEIDTDRYADMLELNVVALTALARLALADMLARGNGRILNVASTAAFQAGPLMAAYYASKAYVLSLSTAMAYETRRTGVTVTCLCPGPTASQFQSRGNMGDAKIMQTGLMDAPAVARIGHRAMMRGKPLVIAGRRNAFLAFLPRLTPRRFAAAVVAHLQRPAPN